MVGYPYEPQGVDCPGCGRHIRLLIDGRPECHSDREGYNECHGLDHHSDGKVK